MDKKFFIFIIIFFSLGKVSAAGNFLELRYEKGYDSGIKKSFCGTHNILELPYGNNCSLGGKVITSGDNFIMLKPYLLFNLGEGFSAGPIFSHDVRGNDLIGPMLKFTKFTDTTSIIGTGEYIFNLENDSEYKEVWVSLSRIFCSWRYYYELRYTNNGEENFQFRPVKLGYRKINSAPKRELLPFFMLQRAWKEWEGKPADSLYLGVDCWF